MIKSSKATLMYLSREYGRILRKCALLNATILMCATVAFPVCAEAEDNTYENALYYTKSSELGSLKATLSKASGIEGKVTVKPESAELSGQVAINELAITANGWTSKKYGVYNDAAHPQATKLTNSSFTNNTATEGAGGAITLWHNSGDHGAGNEVLNSIFEGNISKTKGGAVALLKENGSGDSGKTTFDHVTFKNNKVTEGTGGAIHNEGSDLTIKNSTFSGNKAGDKYNDIYSDGGKITFEGDVTLDGGISGTADVTFAQKSSLTAELMRTTILAKSVTFAGDNTINLKIENGLAGGDYDFIDVSSENSNKSVTGEENVTLFNPVYDLELNDNGQVHVNIKSADAIVDSLDVAVSEQEASTIGALLESNNHSTNLGNQLTDAISSALQNGHQAEAVKAAEELAPTTSQQVISVTQSVNELLSNVTGARMSALGKASGDAFVGGSMWAQGLYNHSKQDASGDNAGFSADTTGVAFGVDGKPNDALTIGVGYGYTYTDADSEGRQVDVDGHNFFVYGQYKPEKFYINTLLNYGFSRYTEKKAPLGIAMKAKYDVNSFAANLMAGYELDNGFTPEGGLRYVLADQESYSDGAQNVSTDNTDVLTAVMGVKYAKELQANEWMVKPSVRLAATYDLMSDDSVANVNVIGGGNYQITGKRLERFGVEAGAGVTATLDNVDITLDYNGGFRKDFQSHTGMLKATYHF